jgi:hypothetical protein
MEPRRQAPSSRAALFAPLRINGTRGRDHAVAPVLAVRYPMQVTCRATGIAAIVRGTANGGACNEVHADDLRQQGCLGLFDPNATTAQPICDATVTVTEGSYSQPLAEMSCKFVGAYERPGTYVVHAARAGFVSKEVGPVRVVMGSGECPHVQEVQLAMPLLPEG